MFRVKIVIICIVATAASVFLFNNCGEFSGVSGISGRDSGVRVSAVANEVKVAFLGDTGIGGDFNDTLNLIAGEGVDAIMINGDFSYEEKDQDDPSPTIMKVWRDQLLEVIDVDKVAVFGALGNHDIDKQDQFTLDGKVLSVFVEYFRQFRSQNAKMFSGCTGGNQIRPDKDVILVNETCTFGNVTIVASGHGVTESPQFSRQFLEAQLDEKLSQAPANNWKVAGYHFTLASMNAAGKGNGSKHTFFDIIRQHGAIGVQAHTHSAMATCPISSEFKKDSKVSCAPGSNYDNRKIAAGTGIYLDSSAGGYEVRGFVPCDNANSSDCGHLYDHISSAGYHRNGSSSPSKSAGSGYGAIFVVFNEGGDASKARVYFKNVDGDTVFNFNIRRDVAGLSSGPSPSPSPSPGPGTGSPAVGAQQYNGVKNGRVLYRVSADLACKPDVLWGVITDSAKYADLASDYSSDRCANGGAAPGAGAPSPGASSPSPAPVSPGAGNISAQQYNGVKNGRVLFRVSSDLACKPVVVTGVITDSAKYSDLERHYDRDRCASR